MSALAYNATRRGRSVGVRELPDGTFQGFWTTAGQYGQFLAAGGKRLWRRYRPQLAQLKAPMKTRAEAREWFKRACANM